MYRCNRLWQHSTGPVVDSVSEAQTITDEDIAEKPKISSKASCEYVRSMGEIGKKAVLLIDCKAAECRKLWCCFSYLDFEPDIL